MFRATPGLQALAHGVGLGSVSFRRSRPPDFGLDLSQNQKDQMPIDAFCVVRSGSDPTWTLSARLFLFPRSLEMASFGALRQSGHQAGAGAGNQDLTPDRTGTGPGPRSGLGLSCGPQAHHGIHWIPSVAPILWRGAWAPPSQPAPPNLFFRGTANLCSRGRAPCGGEAGFWTKPRAPGSVSVVYALAPEFCVDSGRSPASRLAPGKLRASAFWSARRRGSSGGCRSRPRF